MRAEIWFGDLVRVLRALGIDDPVRAREIADLLGLTLTEVPDDIIGEPMPMTAPTTAPPIADVSVVVPAEPNASTDGPLRPITTHVLAEPARVILRDEVPGPPTDRWVGVRPVATADRSRRAVRPPYESLLAPQSTNAILHTMLSRRVQDGPVDLAALIDDIASGRPIHRLPRERVATSRFGVQVMVDLGPAMEPFRRDQDELVDSVRKVVGTAATDVGYFVGTPSRGCGARPEPRWVGYRPPAPGCRVLLLSDLGLNARASGRGRAGRGEWEAFVRLVRKHGCAPIALVPFAPAALPCWLTALFPVVSWDRSTTVGGVRARSSWA